jgi:hypothetical protein
MEQQEVSSSQVAGPRASAPVGTAAQEREIYTPVRHFLGSSSPPMSPEMADISRRLHQTKMELAATKLRMEQEPSANKEFAAAIAALAENRSTNRNAAIRVEPDISWPRLGDAGPGGEEVGDVYKTLDEIFGLADNGAGMSPEVMMVAMRNCLQGSRSKIYDNIAKKNRKPGSSEIDDPYKAYQEMKERLAKFHETAEAQQMRARAEWQHLIRAKRENASKLEAAWDEITSELEDVGLGRSLLELYLAYIQKLGPALGEEKGPKAPP